MGLTEKRKMESSTFDTKKGICSSTTYLRCDIIEDAPPKEAPKIFPCYNGKTLKIHEELVVNGLSAISIKHPRGYCSEVLRTDEASSDIVAEEKKDVKEETGASSQPNLYNESEFQTIKKGIPECQKGSLKNRNSFWNVHRPELSKLTWPQNYVSSAIMQDFFHNHLLIHGTFCEPLHDESNRSFQADEEIKYYSRLREIVPPRILPPDEKVINITDKSRSVNLNDEDLDPEIMVHKSRAEFCVTIGEYVRRPPLKKSVSHQHSKIRIPSTGRIESLPIQHEGLLAKPVLISDERISSVVGHNPSHFSEIEVPLSEESGDPVRLRTILSPREDNGQQATESTHNGTV